MDMLRKVTIYVALFVLCSFSENVCFENLALGKLANQSSVYSDLWGAAKAVDGDKRQEIFSSTCSKTGVGQKTATWNVDLGKIMSIHHVDIYYMKESDSVYESSYRGSFAGFSLYISNSTYTNTESLCYHRLQNGTNSPPSFMSIQCEMIGRYVVIYNERLPGETYPDYYSSTAELELCEVEVFGCQGISQYGDYCLSCPSTCPDGRCNMSTGNCFFCSDGLTGDNCTENKTVRLVGGMTEYEGRVEVYYNGSWGTVCLSYFSIDVSVLRNLSAVVCRSLGLPWNTSEGYCCSRYGFGSGPIWLNDVMCVGNESKIEECSHNGWGNGCSNHWWDVSINCLPNKNMVRLVGGSTVYQGRVEVYRNEVWGTVCDNLWGDQNTAVVCTSLGFSPEGAKTLHGQPFGQGTGQVHMSGIECQGYESSILQCNHSGWESHECDHSRDVSVNCTSYRNITTRLVGSSNPYEGRVEVYQNGSWGTVSDGFFLWDYNNTAVVCRSIGYLWDNATFHYLNKHGSGPIHICNVQCKDTETDLAECRQFENMYNFFCFHFYDVYVSCENETTPPVETIDTSLSTVEATLLPIQTTADFSLTVETTTNLSSHIQSTIGGSSSVLNTSTMLPFAPSSYGMSPSAPTDTYSTVEEKTRSTTHKPTLETTITTSSYILQILSFESSSSVVHEGKSAWLKLQLRSDEMYKVQWFHNEYLITSSSTRYKLTSLETENNTSFHTLFIANVLERDKGEWKITVSNYATYASRNLTIAVIPRLVLYLTPKYNFSVLRGEEIKLLCAVTNQESLLDVSNGSFVMARDGIVLSDVNDSNFSILWKSQAAREADAGRYTCTHFSSRDPVFVSVYVTVIQPEQKRCESEWSEGILWNTTLVGKTKQEPCPAKQKGTATRYCKEFGIWAPPTLINCTTEAFINASSELDGIIEDGIKNTEKVQETVNNTLQMMKNHTSSTNELSAGDLSSSLDILQKIVDVTNSTGSAIEKEVFYTVIDNVLSPNNSKSWTTVSEKTEKDASSILKNMERLSEVVIQHENITATKFSGSNFELTINQTKIDETGIRFPDVSADNVSESSAQVLTFLQLPKQDTKAEKAINYVAVIYKTMSDIFPSDSNMDRNGGNTGQATKKREFVNSPILSLTTQNDLGVLVPPLNLTFGHTKSNGSTEMHAVCVSWDFSLSKWTERGCKVNQSDKERTVCQCNHLTNFAILMRPYSPATEDKQSLKTMSLVGVILSIFFTVLTFVVYILTWRFIKSDQNVIMLNLCGSLPLSYVVFISAVEQTGTEGVCIAITAIIHYIFLVTFFSMLGMGVYYFMSITVTYYAMYVANNFKSRSRVHWFLLAIWGIPIIITTTTLGAFWGKDYHLKFYCWLSMKSGSLYMFIIPVCIIIFLNLLIIVSLVRVLYASSAMTKSSLQKKATSGLRSLGTLLPVLGVTWLFGLLAINENADVFQYMFVIANSLQGFFIFVSHVLLNKKVMQGLKIKYPVVSTLTSIAEHSKKETTSVSRSQSTSKSDHLLLISKKRGIFERLRTYKVKKSNSFMMEKTESTDCPSLASDSHEKGFVRSENESTDNAIKLKSKEGNTLRRFHFSFNINPWKKKYTVTEM